jgi:hypothetical protein
MHFTHVTSFMVEGTQTYILRKPKISPIYELRQRTTKYSQWEIMFIMWTVNASVPATPPAPLIILPFSSNGRGTHGFAPIALKRVSSFQTSNLENVV